ncbi:lactate dehydrogenase [Burkholderia seminalis]|uniref:lactate dehydrogenase n=1 Tax=Burkholderia seminalis TaxID=488731 RepID=UPI001452F9C0|nr:lactate dehydrogenase [Burkholderia seminalis]MCA8430310.1 lactate dehydrogenase [Burkholderia seminalis]VWB09716.1 permease [Burkholderia seminalis]
MGRLWSEELGLAATPVRVLVVGIMRTAWPDGGFVDGTFVDHARARSLSLVLLAVTAVALAVSITMRHSPLWGGVGPVNIAYAQRQLAAAVPHAVDPPGLIGRVRY